METRGYLLATCLVVSALSLLVVACGDDDERQTPDCTASDCFTKADGGVPLDGGSN